MLLKLMDSNDAAVRSAAVKCYAELAGEAELADLLEKSSKPPMRLRIIAMEKALGAICGAAGQQQACVPQLVAALAKAGPEAKLALLRTLSVAGGADALKAVRGAVNDSNKDVHAAAIRVLSEWKTADAIPVLLELAKTSSTPVDKVLSLRGYLGMAARKELPAADKLAICRESAPMIQRDDEKLLLLGALGSLADAASLNLIVAYLDDPGGETRSRGRRHGHRRKTRRKPARRRHQGRAGKGGASRHRQPGRRQAGAGTAASRWRMKNRRCRRTLPVPLHDRSRIEPP